MQSLLLFVAVLVSSASAYHTGSTFCGTHANEGTVNNYCECQDGYVGWHGGINSQGNPEHICGKLAQDNCPGCGFYPVFGSFCTAEKEDCFGHCSFEGFSTLCSAHGYTTTYFQRFLSNNPAHARLLDVHTFGETCQCLPGYMGLLQTNDGGCQGTSGCPCGFTKKHCWISIRDNFCSGKGRDPTGPGVGDAGCTGIAGTLGGGMPFVGCGSNYRSDNILSGFECSCDIGWLGGTAGLVGQCNTNIAATICKGHGTPPNSRFLATTTENNAQGQRQIDCTCNEGYVDDPGAGQCAYFQPCRSYGCGAKDLHGNCSTTIFGSQCSAEIPDNVAGRCCACNITGGYGGHACCPLRFGSTSVTCNGFAGACLNNGECDCPLGTKDPGCCVGCDNSQTCLPDGRCTCPKLGGLVCGAYGTCTSLVSNTVFNCTCNKTSLVDVDGPSGPVAPVNVTYGGKFCCPIINGVVCGGGGATCTSTTLASDPQTGSCTGFPSFSQGGRNFQRTGRFGCPIWVEGGQTKECGLGVCQTNGACKCPNNNFAGPACDINFNCNPSVTTNECNGGGLCGLDSVGTSGLGSYLEDLHFDDLPNKPYETADGLNITDDGAVEFLKRVYISTFGFDPKTKPAESSYYLSNLTLCQQAGTNRAQCLWNMLSSCHAARTAYIGTFGSIELFVESAFKNLHPARIVPPPAGTPGESYMSQQVVAFQNNCTAASQREGTASLLAWELWLQYYRTDPSMMPPTSAITLLPSHTGVPYHCRCNAPSPNAQIGQDRAAGGPRCQFQCLVGSDLQVCSGFRNGVLRGFCTGVTGVAQGTCECGAGFGGNACQFPLTPGCIEPNSQEVFACGGTRRGRCVEIPAPGAPSAFFCNCTAAFDKPHGAVINYCSAARCVPPDTNLVKGECNGRGLCNQISSGVFRCDCSSYLTTLFDTGSSNIIPFLATGNACERNGTSSCANFKQAAGQPPGVGNWQVCSGRGTCSWNYGLETGTCVCQLGYSGSRCELTLCSPDCNSNQICDTGTGTCQCTGFRQNPAGCTAGNRTCECSQSVCDHGVPSADGTSCVCDSGWKAVTSGVNTGRCSVVQCRLVVHNDQGVRPCIEPQDLRCSDLHSITQSLQQGCCVDTCPLCILNTTANTRSCNCDALSGGLPCYDSLSEMCQPKCHGNDVLHPNPPNCDSSTNPITCHCQHVALAANQFADLRCQRYTCLNGALRFQQTCNPALQQCCDCSQTAYSGSFCSTSICGTRGTPLANGTACDCFAPFKRSGTNRDCNTDSCSPGVVVSDPASQTKPFYCDCPGSTFVGANNLSCTALDCQGQHAGLCSVCKHGTPFLFNRQVQCDCTGTSFTGTDCNRAVCQNGGIVDTSNTTRCLCVPPTQGQFCESVVCLNGGQPLSSTCNCPTQWTGNSCQVPASAATPNSTTPSSSSSSTGGSSTAVPTPSSAESADALSTGAIIGIVAAGSVVVFFAIGLGVYLYIKPAASAATVASVPMTSSRYRFSRSDEL